ncbi:hypothetical protein XENTR_v10001107 [Xenopus tropicalis]|uniref:17beta-estradiol 17-dehydrogenase n=1 Tax=Xenopus tropicalis TaxID=8364 RepID=F7BWI7_XENTR|eukprot:NP_001011240.1 hydroxysteroid (17-beta) dehydrogenase 13 [Xenopus tropicalis]
MNIILEYMFLLFIAVYSYMESFVKLFLPVNRKSVAGNIVLITGSGHGIGRRTALEFAKHESILVLWDINQKGVEETADECRKLGATAYAFVVDCSTRNDIYRCAEKVKQDIGDVDILINNAGVVFGTEFLKLQDHQIEKTFSVNILAHFWTTKSFLSAMMKKDRGHIVTVASIAGQLGVPYLVDYCASKFGLVGFHESLTSELKLLGKDGVKTTCLCPVFVNTGFVQNPSTRVWPVLKTEDVVKCLMEGILTNKKMIIVPSSVKYSLIMNQFLPERVIATMTKMQDIQFSTPYRCDKKED